MMGKGRKGRSGNLYGSREETKGREEDLIGIVSEGIGRKGRRKGSGTKGE